MNSLLCMLLGEIGFGYNVGQKVERSYLFDCSGLIVGLDLLRVHGRLDRETVSPCLET